MNKNFSAGTLNDQDYKLLIKKKYIFSKKKS